MERVISATVSTECWLGDTAAFYLHRASTPTNVALEKCLTHLRDYSRSPDHHSADGDQLVYVLGIQVSHAGHLFHAKWTNLHTDWNFKLNHTLPHSHVLVASKTLSKKEW